MLCSCYLKSSLPLPFYAVKPKGYCPIYAGAILQHHQLNWAHEVQPVYDTYAHANLQFKICTAQHLRPWCFFWHTMVELEVASNGRHCYFASSWCSNFKTQSWVQWSWTIQFQILYDSANIHQYLYTYKCTLVPKLTLPTQNWTVNGVKLAENQDSSLKEVLCSIMWS